jgi:hypothetical protein
MTAQAPQFNSCSAMIQIKSIERKIDKLNNILGNLSLKGLAEYMISEEIIEQ